MKERKECKECWWFSKNLAWWDVLLIDVEDRKNLVGRCIRPRDNWSEYPIFMTEKKKSCKYFKKK